MRKTTAMNSLFSALLVIACPLLIVQATNLVSMRRDDAYGRGMSHALGILLSIGLWGILTALFALVRTKGPFPSFSGWAVLVLLPASLAAIIAVHNLFRNPPSPAWLIPPAIIPPLILLLFAAALWFPALRPRVVPFAINSILCGALLLSALPWLGVLINAKQNAAAEELQKQQQLAEADTRRARFAGLNTNSPLSEWLEFAVWGSDTRDQALAGIRQLPRRQADAETLLAKGEGVILEMLPYLDLQATPALCANAREFFCNHVKSFAGPEENPNSLPLGIHRLEHYDKALVWFSEKHGDVSEALDCIENFALKHPDSPERASLLAYVEKLRQTPK